MRLGGGRFNDLNSLKRPGVTLYHRVIASSISDPKPDYDLSQTLLSKTVDAMREMRLSRLTQEAMLIGKEIPVDAIDREIKVASLALYSPNKFGKNVSELACWVQAKSTRNTAIR